MDKKEKIIWTHQSSIGNENIDKEHQVLIEIINALIELIELDKGRGEFAMILSKMTDYSLFHFKKEEDFMRRFAYPDLIKHHNYHSDYIYKVAMFNSALLKVNPPDPIEIIDFLEKWWKNHILTIDKNYEEYHRKNHPDVPYEH